MTLLERIQLQRANEQMEKVEIIEVPMRIRRVFPCKIPGCLSLTGRTSKSGLCKQHVNELYTFRRRMRERQAKEGR